MGELTQRLFFGIELDDEVRHALAAVLAAWTEPLPGKPVPPPNWHVTLRFLGAATETQRDLVLGGIEECLDERPFSVRLGRFGAFPRPAKATVLFVGLSEGDDALGRLAGVCEEAATAAGFDAEERPFHPHVTLARIRPPRNVTRLVEAFDPIGAAQVVDAITLFASHLGRGGARYEALERIPLRAGAR